MATKPTIADSRWATDGAAELTAPSSGLRDSGFVDGTPIVADYPNVLHKEAYKWAQYLDEGILTGAFHLNSPISPAAITGSNNDYDPTGWSSGSAGAQVVRQDLSAHATLTGLAGGATGRLAILVNIDSAFWLTLAHESGSSSVANRFSFPGSKDIKLAPGGTAILRYDATSSRWRVIGGDYKRSRRRGLVAAAGQYTANGDYFSAVGSFASDSAGETFVLPIPVTEGERVTGYYARLNPSDTAGTVTCTLRRHAHSDGTSTIIGTPQVTSGTAEQVVEESGLDEVATDDFDYYLEFTFSTADVHNVRSGGLIVDTGAA